MTEINNANPLTWTRAQRGSAARLLNAIAYHDGKGSARFHVETYERIKASGMAEPVPGAGWRVTPVGYAFIGCIPPAR
jgi:hypothetical protein